jgi:riboflavin synthase
MKADGRFDGHVVQGHVDGIGTVKEMKSLGESAEIRIEVSPDLDRFLVEKGSISVDGISLTVYDIRDHAFSVALIPYTLEVTNLQDARPGTLVNLEADVIAKYVERLLAARGL